METNLFIATGSKNVIDARLFFGSSPTPRRGIRAVNPTHCKMNNINCHSADVGAKYSCRSRSMRHNDRFMQCGTNPFLTINLRFFRRIHKGCRYTIQHPGCNVHVWLFGQGKFFKLVDLRLNTVVGIFLKKYDQCGWTGAGTRNAMTVKNLQCPRRLPCILIRFS